MTDVADLTYTPGIVCRFSIRFGNPFAAEFLHFHQALVPVLSGESHLLHHLPYGINVRPGYNSGEGDCNHVSPPLANRPRMNPVSTFGSVTPSYIFSTIF